MLYKWTSISLALSFALAGYWTVKHSKSFILGRLILLLLLPQLILVTTTTTWNHAAHHLQYHWGRLLTELCRVCSVCGSFCMATNVKYVCCPLLDLPVGSRMWHMNMILCFSVFGKTISHTHTLTTFLLHLYTFVQLHTRSQESLSNGAACVCVCVCVGDCVSYG